MNGGLDSHTMEDLSLIGSVRGRNKHSQSIYIAARCDTSKKKRAPSQKTCDREKAICHQPEIQDEGADPKSSSDC